MIRDLLVATCAYPAASRFFGIWADGVRSAAADRRGTRVLVVHEGAADIDPAFRRALGDLELDAEWVGASVSPVASRRAMIDAALRTGCQAVVFCDIDDRMTDDAIELHLSALARADISYGDLELADESLQPSGRRLFDGLAPKACLSGGDLDDVNAIGFSNSAILASCLRRRPNSFPDGISAVDWWLFSGLLDGGCRAAWAGGVVGLYRQHAGNIVGAMPATAGMAGHRLEIVRRHYAARGAPSRFSARLAAVERLLSDKGLLAEVVSSARAVKGPWYGDVAAWVDLVLEREGAAE